MLPRLYVTQTTLFNLERKYHGVCHPISAHSIPLNENEEYLSVKEHNEKIAALKAENERLKKALENINMECCIAPKSSTKWISEQCAEALAQDDIFERIENSKKENLPHIKVKQGKGE